MSFSSTEVITCDVILANFESEIPLQDEIINSNYAAVITPWVLPI